jgi:hypothetical protein
MRNLSATAETHHLQAMVEGMVREGRSEREIVAAVKEADNGPLRRPLSRRWSRRLVRVRRSR